MKTPKLKDINLPKVTIKLKEKPGIQIFYSQSYSDFRYFTLQVYWYINSVPKHLLPKAMYESTSADQKLLNNMQVSRKFQW